MFGLGAQEILLLLCCGGLPAIGAVLVILANRQKTQKSNLPDDDFDE